MWWLQKITFRAVKRNARLSDRVSADSCIQGSHPDGVTYGKKHGECVRARCHKMKRCIKEGILCSISLLNVDILWSDALFKASSV